MKPHTPLPSEVLPSDSLSEARIPLMRVLGLGTCILLVAGTMIGTGVFKKIVPMAATGLSRPSILGAWILAGIISLMGAFTFGGLALLSSDSGGPYQYLRKMFGPVFGYLFGWGYFIIIGTGGNAALAFVFAQSVRTLIPLGNPLQAWQGLTLAGTLHPFSDLGVKLLAFSAVLVLTWINYRGVQKVSRLNNIITLIKVLGILAVIVLGLFLFPGPANNPGTGVLTAGGQPGLWLSAFFSAMLGASWAYTGYPGITCISGEIKDPQRNLPVAIVTGVGLVIVLYVLANAAYMKAMPLQELATIGPDRVAASEVMQRIAGDPGRIFLGVLIILCTLGALNSQIFFFSRIYFRMARDGQFFPSAARVHPVFRTPYMALLFPMIWVLPLIISGTFDTLTDMVVFTEFMFFVLLCIGLFRMKRKGQLSGRIAGYPWAPAIFLLFSLGLVFNTLLTQPGLSLTGLILILCGLPFYRYWRHKARNSGNGI